MAYAITDDLHAFILMTERGRLKYKSLISNPRVAIMIDKRENLGRDPEKISCDARDEARAFCLARHPALQSFPDSPS